MGVYIRKSINFGLFRLNISKSGIGVSVGVKGARVGERPDGKEYVTAGKKGVFFRKFFPMKRKQG